MDRDIVNAINAEQEYINQSNSNISLLEMLIPFGYTTLDEYFNDKVKYQVALENIDI